MKASARLVRTSAIAGVVTTLAFLVFAGHSHLRAQNKNGFPDGFDAVQAAPKSHRVIFENALVRVLEVTMPPPGQTEPMHHHHWPSFFLDWDTGGPSPHIRYHRGDGTVVEQVSESAPKHPGRWSVHWMKPEPMHAIETVEYPPAPGEPDSIRVEIKCKP